MNIVANTVCQATCLSGAPYRQAEMDSGFCADVVGKEMVYEMRAIVDSVANRLFCKHCIIIM